MPSQKFNEFVKNELNTLQEGNSKEDLAEWLKAIDSFYDQIEHYLRPYTNQKSIVLSYENRDAYEDLLGKYSIKIAEIKIGRKRVKIVPIGKFVVGAYGRIDMLGNLGKLRFVLVDKAQTEMPGELKNKPNRRKSIESKGAQGKQLEWKIATNPPVRLLDLNEDSFLEAVMDISNA